MVAPGPCPGALSVLGFVPELGRSAADAVFIAYNGNSLLQAFCLFLFSVMKNVTSVCALVGALMNEKTLFTSMLLVISVNVLL